MKRGISITSLIVYVALFFVLTTLVTSITNNFTYTSLSDKGSILISEQEMKLHYNLFTSSKASTSFSVVGNTIAFSNGDYYEYDIDKKRVNKNGGFFIDSVENFTVIDESLVTLNEIEDFKALAISVKFEKYDVVSEKQMFFALGE